MFHSSSCSNGIKFKINFFKKYLLRFSPILFFIYSFSISSQAQWVNDPAINSKIALDTNDPINISSAADQKGGAFIFWQDNKPDSKTDIFFMHLNPNGEISFRADGKIVSESKENKFLPMSSANLPNSAVVVWKQMDDSIHSNLFAQKVLNNGNLGWLKTGLKITNEKKEITGYDLTTDKNGNSFVLYLTKSIDANNDYEVRIKKISSTGNLLLEGKNNVVFKSKNIKTLPSIINDKKGGAFLFWLENENAKSIIYSMRIDSSGSAAWGKNPISISNTTQSVAVYSASCTNNSQIYIAWQILKLDKDIYHQFISPQGKNLWRAGGILASNLKGDQSFPQTLISDSSLILSWTNEINKDKNIFIQKYIYNGKQLWKENGLLVAGKSKDQFGQKLVGDKSGGAVLAWIDRRIEGKWGNIYSQKISNIGELNWNADGIASGIYDNSEKSYLSTLSDESGGIIIIFKDKRNNKAGIYAQKVFGSGTYISQILNFQAEVKEDSIAISWNAMNENKLTTYDLQKVGEPNSGENEWKTIKTFYNDSLKSDNFYSFFYKPNDSGTLNFRVIQKNKNGYVQSSKISSISYFAESSGVMVTQNNPNPFSDSTSISFYLPEKAKVSVEFFNSQIKTVKEINNQIFPAGQNRIIFYSKNLKPGIYFYRFKVDDFVDVKKMVITN